MEISKAKLSSIFCILGLIFLSGCSTQIDPNVLLEANAQVNTFLEEHPNAQVFFVFYSQAQSIDLEIEYEENCGVSFIEKDLYRFYISDPDSGLDILGYLDPNRGDIDCLVKTSQIVQKLDLDEESLEDEEKIEEIVVATGDIDSVFYSTDVQLDLEGISLSSNVKNYIGDIEFLLQDSSQELLLSFEVSLVDGQEKVYNKVTRGVVSEELGSIWSSLIREIEDQILQSSISNEKIDVRVQISRSYSSEIVSFIEEKEEESVSDDRVISTLNISEVEGNSTSEEEEGSQNQTSEQNETTVPVSHYTGSSSLGLAEGSEYELYIGDDVYDIVVFSVTSENARIRINNVEEIVEEDGSYTFGELQLNVTDLIRSSRVGVKGFIGSTINTDNFSRVSFVFDEYNERFLPLPNVTSSLNTTLSFNEYDELVLDPIFLNLSLDYDTETTFQIRNIRETGFYLRINGDNNFLSFIGGETVRYIEDLKVELASISYSQDASIPSTVDLAFSKELEPTCPELTIGRFDPFLLEEGDCVNITYSQSDDGTFENIIVNLTEIDEFGDVTVDGEWKGDSFSGDIENISYFYKIFYNGPHTKLYLLHHESGDGHIFHLYMYFRQFPEDVNDYIDRVINLNVNELEPSGSNVFLDQEYNDPNRDYFIFRDGVFIDKMYRSGRIKLHIPEYNTISLSEGEEHLLIYGNLYALVTFDLDSNGRYDITSKSLSGVSEVDTEIGSNEQGFFAMWRDGEDDRTTCTFYPGKITSQGFSGSLSCDPFSD